MVETQQQTRDLPLAGRSTPPFGGVGVGELRCATALLPERGCPHPSVARRAQAAKAVANQKVRAAGPPREGEVRSDSRGDDND